MSSSEDSNAIWLPVIGRALAFLCMQQVAHTEQTVLERAIFLENLGVPEAEAAVTVGSTLASIREMKRRKKGAKRGRKK